MSSNKRTLLKIILTAPGGRGCSKTKPSDVYDPTTNPNRTSSLTCGFSVDNDENFTCSTVSEPETDSKSSKFVIPKLNGSVAVEKDSKDPYKDFRHFMLQIIFEKEIHSQSDLQDLLECFLQLSCPSHHQVIVRSFTEICEQAFPHM